MTSSESQPGLDVDVGRRRRRHHQLRGRDPAGGDVAAEGGAALLVQVGDVVGGVAGGVGDPHPEHALAAGQRGHVLRRHRQDPAPEVLELVAVEAAGAGQQLRGVDQVRRAALVDVDLEVGPALDHRPGRGGVVEVDVGEQDRPRLLAAELGDQVRQRGLRPRVDQHPVDLPAGDHVGAAEVADVDGAHGWKLIEARPASRGGGVRPRPRPGSGLRLPAFRAGPARARAARSRARPWPCRSWPRR